MTISLREPVHVYLKSVEEGESGERERVEEVQTSLPLLLGVGPLREGRFSGRTKPATPGCFSFFYLDYDWDPVSALGTAPVKTHTQKERERERAGGQVGKAKDAGVDRVSETPGKAQCVHSSVRQAVWNSGLGEGITQTNRARQGFMGKLGERTEPWRLYRKQRLTLNKPWLGLQPHCSSVLCCSIYETLWYAMQTVLPCLGLKSTVRLQVWWRTKSDWGQLHTTSIKINTIHDFLLMRCSLTE